MKGLSFAILAESPVPWMGTNHAAVAVSSRVRLARNLAGICFPRKATSHARKAVLRRMTDVLEHGAGLREPRFCAMEDLPPLHRDLLCERHLISAEMTHLCDGAGVVVANEETLTAMINEEDHVRIQAFAPGMGLEDLWETVAGVARTLEGAVSFAYRDDLGYLTPCPTNLGTGIRASVMLHVAGLRLRGDMEAIGRAAGELGMAVRGAFGEGSQPVGGFLQFSNQSCLGEDEQTILGRIRTCAERLVQAENGVRDQLLQDEPAPLYDAVGRALGTLRHAYAISTSEAFEHLGTLRLGVHCGLLPGIDAAGIDTMLVAIQPGHLRAATKQALADKPARDAARARLIRQRLFKDPTAA